MPGVALRPEYYSNESLAQQNNLNSELRGAVTFAPRNASHVRGCRAHPAAAPWNYSPSGGSGSSPVSSSPGTRATETTRLPSATRITRTPPP